MFSEFMGNLHKKILDAGKSQKTATLYIQNLKRIRGENFNNLLWLSKPKKIFKAIEDYSLNSQKSLISSIITTLKLNKNDDKIIKTYQEKLLKIINEIEDKPKNIKTETEKEAWINWDQILQKRDQLYTEVKDFKKSSITLIQFLKVLKMMVLSLYTLIPPRRNVDFLEMYILNRKYDLKDLDENKNYIDIKNDKFIFNYYKTNKQYGQQIIKFDKNEKLKEALKLYLSLHPTFNKKSTKDIKFLVYADGEGLEKINAITRILNGIFKKNIGSSMLRKIYLSSKYADDLKELKKDNEKMAHSKEEALNTYVKIDDKNKKE